MVCRVYACVLVAGCRQHASTAIMNSFSVRVSIHKRMSQSVHDAIDFGCYRKDHGHDSGDQAIVITVEEGLLCACGFFMLTCCVCVSVSGPVGKIGAYYVHIR